ncbi:MAG TPA: hypothetical protein VLB44_09635 [Kofleriaceae bacterium]|nr:hypothetical protein [Kofleriaceae bacterium]
MADLDSHPSGAAAFSEIEEEFFRVGDAMSAEAERALVPEYAQARVAAEPPAAEEDWDWQIAIARARHATQPGM